MKQFTLELNKNVQRPVVKLADWHQFNVMLDTGALFPVWVVDDENHMLNVTVPDRQSCVRNLTIWEENGHLQVLCVSGDAQQQYSCTV